MFQFHAMVGNEGRELQISLYTLCDTKMCVCSSRFLENALGPEREFTMYSTITHFLAIYRQEVPLKFLPTPDWSP